jgi:hypothetical protein
MNLGTSPRQTTAAGAASISVSSGTIAGASASASGKRVIKKRRKDPLAPKRPSNAFFIFSQQHRQQAREEKKEGNQSELTKFLGQRWKSMPSTEKQVKHPSPVFTPESQSRIHSDLKKLLKETLCFHHLPWFGFALEWTHISGITWMTM